MINQDFQRSFYQYKIHKDIKHINITILNKLILSCIWLFYVPLVVTKLFYSLLHKHCSRKKRVIVFDFNSKEPMKTILSELDTLENIEIIKNPKSLPVFPLILLKDFISSLCTQPLWTLKNLDFFGALSIKISIYYGYKVKYNLNNLTLFQEYSFYSSYLTRVFEYENGSLYNLMHGIPGEEASFFRFTKCFVWGDYFKNYYINNMAESSQFIVAGSIFHTKLKSLKVNTTERYDIIFALQGSQYSNRKYTEKIFSLLNHLHDDLNLKIAVKPHPQYEDDISNIKFDILETSPYEAIYSGKLIISQFSTMLLDAKSIGKKVFSFLPFNQKKLVGYLNEDEIAFTYLDAYMKIMKIINNKKEVNESIIDLNMNTVKVIEYETT